MARSRSPKRDKAFKIYKEHKGNIKLKDIATQLKISDIQVRKWKSTDKWEQKLKGTLPLKSNVANKVNNEDKESIKKDVEEVLNNNDLTDKQKLFCIYYPKCFNATKAAIKAGYSKNRASEIGYQLLQKTTVKTEIQRLKQNKLNRAMISPDDIFQRYLDIAFANMTDYVSFGQRSYKVKDEENEEKTVTCNYIDLHDSNNIDGSLITEIKEGKAGISIKLHDSMKALDWLTNHMNIATDEQKLRCEKLKTEIEKARGDKGNNKTDDVLKDMLEGLKDE
jgi:phage terminase small subunit